MVPKQEPPQPLKLNSPPGGKWPAPPGVERTVVVNTLQALGELTETQLGLEKGLEFLQLWRRMETEKYYWVAPVLPSELSPGQHGSCESVLGSMPGRQRDLNTLVFPVPTEKSASVRITHRCFGRPVVSVHLLYYHRQL